MSMAMFNSFLLVITRGYLYFVLIVDPWTLTHDVRKHQISGLYDVIWCALRVCCPIHAAIPKVWLADQQKIWWSEENRAVRPPKTGGSKVRRELFKTMSWNMCASFPIWYTFIGAWVANMVLALYQFIPTKTCNNSKCSSRYPLDGDIYQLNQPKVQCSWQQAMVLPQSFQTHFC